MLTARFSNNSLFQLRARLISTAISALTMATCSAMMSTNAMAQSSDGIESVTVTGTKIQNEGYSSPTPVTSVSAADIQAQVPTTVASVLSAIPSFRPSASPTTSGVNSLGGGQITADLRGLGSTRTLILVDGKRFVPVSSDGNPDLTQIPTLLVQNVEVVTGGASAAYGSDAVAGVVNFRLKDHIDGLQATIQAGSSEYGDDTEEQVGVAFGGKALDNRLTYMAGINYINNEGILGQYTRPWGRKEYGLLTNSAFATNGLPNFIISPNVHVANESNGGLITSGPLKGTAFGPGGVPYAFNFGTVFGSSMIGGEQVRPNPTLNSYLGKPFSALISMWRLRYAITDNIIFYLDLAASRTTAGGASQQARDTSVTIHNDNPYLPASIVTAMATNHITTFTLGRYYDDTGPIQLHTRNRTGRVIAGFQGTIDALGSTWNWDTNYQFGENRYNLNFGPNNRNQANFLRAVDAVKDSSGNIVCRNLPTGCIPVNIFGDGSETLNSYVNGSATYSLVMDQTVADLDLNGNPFQTWAGKVSLATGFEFRREAARAIADPVSTQTNADGSTGGWILGNQKNFDGAYNIVEGYLETDVPLLAADSGFGAIDVNGAVRLTSYSTAGGVTTWKVGANWQLGDDLRLRGTRSHDVRAPNLSELFQGGTGSSNTSVFDPKANGGAGGTVQVRQIGSGNLNLKPERAETWTGGFVWQPSWLKGFAQSIDYYSIRVADVISSIGAPTLVTGCNAGNQLYCQNVILNPNGTINFVNSPSLNLNSLKTSGIDFETTYNFTADSLVDGAPGNINARLLATYVNEDTTILPGNVVQNTIGQVSNFQRVSGVPKWTGQLSLAYDFDPWSVNMRVKYVGAGIFSFALHNGTGAANTIANNDVHAVEYVDVGGSYNFAVWGMQAQLFGSINNLLDQTPPNVPSQAAGGTNESSTNTTFYDPIGRLFKMGLRFSMN